MSDGGRVEAAARARKQRDEAQARVAALGAVQARMGAWLLRQFFARCPGGPKMLHETLCIAQDRVGNSPLDKRRQVADVYRLQWLIDAVESSGAYRHGR